MAESSEQQQQVVEDSKSVPLEPAGGARDVFEVSLPKVGHIDREQAIVNGILIDNKLRMAMVAVLAVIFLGLNLAVFWFLWKVFKADMQMLAAKPPVITAADRLVKPDVLMALIGATVIQVGASMAIIVRYLFPQQRADRED